MSQESFEFAAADLSIWHKRLVASFGPLGDVPRRRPVGQLVKSLISSRTRDAVSLAAYHRLGARWRSAGQLANASPAEIESVIADVTFAEVKAPHLISALGLIGRERPDFRLDFLAGWPVPDALAWLERLPGVGRKVAAATLNASTLNRPAFIVDSHVHRVLQRLGFIGPRTTPAAASELVTAATPGWPPEALLELFARMKRLGQLTCRFETADCAACPLAASCRTARKAMDARHPRH